jgi:FkbH-like protein
MGLRQTETSDRVLGEPEVKKDMSLVNALHGPDLRQRTEESIATGNFQTARAQLLEHWQHEKGPAAAALVTSFYESFWSKMKLLPYRLAILRSFTVEPVVPLLRAAGFLAGFDLTIHVGDFNAYAQEILDPQSSLYQFKPDAVMLALQTRDIAPDLWGGYDDLTEEESKSAVARVRQHFADLVQAFRANSGAHLIIHGLEAPDVPSQGILDSQNPNGQSAVIHRLNQELRELAQMHSGVYILDYDSLVARYGRIGWHDERKWLTVRMPIASGHLVHLAEEWLRFLHPLSGKLAKALVVDLDNTLWGGVIGEDGLDGIKIGAEHPGSSYRDLQRAMMDIYRRGILLAICSKNNFDDAIEVLDKHAGMILRRQHFAAMRINWLDKAQNLREIANELNIGIDALAFLDDNPVERERIRAVLPEVAVLELPADPRDYAAALRDCPLFERLVLSDEDKQRGIYYAAQRERLQLETGCTSKEDFLRSLQQEVEIAPADSSTLARIAQLTQKTNQFNVTTRRYKEQEIAQMASTPNCSVVSVRVRDRFGDNGLVGVAIARDEAETREIDTFLLSCRVIGRTVETAILSYLVQDARRRGLNRIQGWFLPTKKNAPASDFYSQHGFALRKSEPQGALWTLDLRNGLPKCPDWIKLTVQKRDQQK